MPAARDKHGLIVAGICVGLTILVWLVFGQTLWHDFVNYDDDKYVYENAEIIRGFTFPNILWAFTHSHAALWHPLTSITHMLDCQFYGLKPAGHHFSNVVLHSVAVILLFLVLRNMTGGLWRSAFVAAVFAIHPLRVESVAWIAERKDALSAVFFMLTLGAYVRYARRPSLLRYVGVALLVACGLMSKATFVTVPLVLLLLDYWPLRRTANEQTWPRLILEKIPLLALAAAAATVTFFAQTVTMSSLDQLALLPRIKNAIVSIVIYLGQMFWPRNLALFYPHPHDHLNLGVVGGSALLVAGITVVAVLVRQKRPHVLVGWLWYLGMLVPVSGIVQVGLQGHADRFTYLPHIGISILIAWTVADLARRWRHRELVLGAATATVLTAFTLCAWRQTNYWRNSITAWTRALAVTSDNDTAHQNLAAALWRVGRVGEAKLHIEAGNIVHWQTVLKDYPFDVNAHNELGVAFVQRGEIRKGIEQWRASLEIDPHDGNAANNVAWVLATYPDNTIRNGAKAVELAERAAHFPGGTNPLVLRTLAAAYAESGHFAEAIATAQQATDMAIQNQNPALAETLRNEIKSYEAGEPHRETPGPR